MLKYQQLQMLCKHLAINHIHFVSLFLVIQNHYFCVLQFQNACCTFAAISLCVYTKYLNHYEPVSYPPPHTHTPIASVPMHIEMGVLGLTVTPLRP